MASSSAKKFQIVLSFVLSGALLAWMAHEVEWGPVVQQLQHMQYWAFVPVTLLVVVHYFLRAERWRFLLAGEAPPLMLRFKALMVGNFATYVLPLRAGEFVRPFYLSRGSKIPFATSFASIVIERFFDLATVLLSFGAVLLSVEGLPKELYRGAMSLSVLAVGILVFMILGSFLPRQISALCGAVLSILPARISKPLHNFVEELLSGVSVLHDPKRLVGTLFYTILVWGTCYLQFELYFLIFGLAPAFIVAVTTGVIVALAVALPSAPGFIGVYQVACLAAFSVFGLPADVAAAYSIVTHVHQYIFTVLCGSLVLSRSNLSLRDLRAPAGEAPVVADSGEGRHL